MPYTRKGLCVFKKKTGKKVGCSKTTAEAKKYLQALEINAHKESFDDTINKILHANLFEENIPLGTDKVDMYPDPSESKPVDQKHCIHAEQGCTCDGCEECKTNQTIKNPTIGYVNELDKQK